MTAIVPVLPSENPYGTSPFLTERQYRLERFCLLAPQLAGKRVALYGTGANAHDVVERLGDVLDVVCLVDDARAGERLWGLPVLGLEGALSVGIDVLVIAAKADSLIEIARRIATGCERAGVSLIDLYGNDLLELMQAQVRLDWWSLETLAASADVLCVDMEILVGADASLGLEDALERWGRSRARAAGDYLPWRLVREARWRGARVLVVVEPWEEPLKPFLPQGVADEILITSEVGCMKENGLFRVISSRYPATRIAHVGTSPARDGIMPRLMGVEGWSLARGDGAACRDAVRAMGQCEPCDLVVTGADAALIEAVGTRGESPGDLRAFGRHALGPVLLGYVTWLVGKVAAQSLDGVVFGARDGWVLLEVYERFRALAPGLGLPRGIYLPTSRKAALRALLDQDAFRDMLPSVCEGMDATSMLCGVAGLGSEEVAPPATGDAKGMELWSAIEANAPAVACHARESRKGMQTLANGLGVHRDGRYAYCDFVALGTCQFLLEEALSCKFQGLYVGVRQADYLTPGNPLSYLNPACSALCDRYLGVESFVSSPQPPVVDYLPDGTPVFGPERRASQEIVDMLLVHDGVLELVDAFLADPRSRDGMVSPTLADALFAANDDPSLTLTAVDDLRDDGGHER